MNRRPTLPMLTDRDWDRLSRYVIGDASAEEAESTRGWVAADSSRRELVEQLTQAWDAAKVDDGTDDETWDTAAAWRNLGSRAVETTAARSRPAETSLGLRV